MLSLDAMLKSVADAREWSDVVHRCAWCGRIATARGEWVLRPIDAAQLTTDGMCPTCGARALREIVARHLRDSQLAA